MARGSALIGCAAVIAFVAAITFAALLLSGGDGSCGGSVLHSHHSSLQFLAACSSSNFSSSRCPSPPEAVAMLPPAGPGLRLRTLVLFAPFGTDSRTFASPRRVRRR